MVQLAMLGGAGSCSRVIVPVRVLAVALAAMCGLSVVSQARAAAPANDNYLASTTMARPDGRVLGFFHDVVDTTGATTQADLFDPNREGLPFGGAPPETTACGATPYGKTVWYDFAPQVDGGVEMIVAGFDTVVTVYRYDARTAQITGVVACQNDSAGPSEDVQLPRVNKGVSYTVQIGGVGAGAAAAAGSLDFTFRFFADRDRDGVLDEVPDKCPDQRGIPDAGGCPPRLALTPALGWDGTGSGIRLKRFVVDKVPAGARVQARCRRCHLTQTVNARRAGPLRLKRFLGRSLPAGATIEVFETHAATGSGRFKYGAIGSYFRYRVLGPNKVSAPTKRCLKPGSRTPRKKCT